MKKRNRNALIERAGLLAVEAACNNLDLIWRDLLQEDVGIDGTIEIAIGEFPTGKLIGAQVKSGASYIRSETPTTFRFYPDADDMQYWASVSIPMFLLLHDPRIGTVYWADLSKHIQERVDNPLDSPSIIFSKSNVMNEKFSAYLRGRFDLLLYSDEEYAAAQTDLRNLEHTLGTLDSAVTFSALDLFVEGLWGLCSKLQFHSSMMSELVRREAMDKPEVLLLNYTLDRASLYPFLSRYFNLLSKHHLATLDGADINHSLYAKLEFPTFIAPLTTNGRRFTEYLRKCSTPRVHDNQFFTLALLPHVQIEVYSDFKVSGDEPIFGKFTDVLAICFNPHLDYYHLEHWHRAEGAVACKICSQSIFYSELKEYINHHFGLLPKDRLWFRYREIPLTPLICWLEEWNDNHQPMPGQDLQGKSSARLAGFHDEWLSISAPVGVVSVSEPKLPQFPSPILANGEYLHAPDS